MFVASFQQVSSDKFKEDRKGEKPFIGKLICGKTKSSLINGTVFKTQNYIPNKLYACQTVEVTLEDGRKVHNVEVLDTVSVIDLPELIAKLGAPKLLTEVAVETPKNEEIPL